MRVFLLQSCLACFAVARRMQVEYERLPSHSEYNLDTLERAGFADHSETLFKGVSQKSFNRLTRLLLATNPALAQRLHRTQQHNGLVSNVRHNDHIRSKQPAMNLIPAITARVTSLAADRLAVLTGASAASAIIAFRQARKRRRAEVELEDLRSSLEENELAQKRVGAELEGKIRETKELSRKLEEVERRRAAAQQGKEQAEKRLAEKRREMTKEVDKNIKSRRDAEKALEAKIKEVSQYEKLDTKLKPALSNAEKMKDMLEEQSSELKATLLAMTSEAEGLTKELEKLKKQGLESKSELEKSSAALEKQLSESQIALKAKTSEVDKLSTELTNLKAESTRVKVEIEKAKTLLDKQLSESKSALETKTRQVDKLQDEVAKLRTATPKSTSSGKPAVVTKQLSTQEVLLQQKTDELESLARDLIDDYEKVQGSSAPSKRKAKPATVTKQLSKQEVALQQKTDELESLARDLIDDYEKMQGSSAPSKRKAKPSSAPSRAQASDGEVNELKAEVKKLESMLSETKAKELEAAQEHLQSLHVVLNDQTSSLKAKLKGSEEAWRKFDEESERERKKLTSNFSSFENLAKEESKVDALNARKASIQENIAKLESETVEEGGMGWFRSKQIEWELDEVRSSLNSVTKQSSDGYNKLIELRAATAADEEAMQAAMAELNLQLAERQNKLAEELEYSKEDLVKAQGEAADLQKKATAIGSLLQKPQSSR